MIYNINMNLSSQKKLISIFSFVFFIVFIFLFSSHNTQAQNINGGQTRESDVSVDVLPSVPGPNENITINLTSLAVDLDKADITWIVNGKFAYTGKGQKSYKTTTGGVGTTTTIDVAIVINRNSRIDKKIVIQPSEIDVLWEVPDAYVPPFYKGKAMPTSESTLKLIALPNIRNSKGVKTSAGNLVYKWKKNNISLPDQSGYGKNTLTVTTSYFNSKEEISLEATSATENFGAKTNLIIKTLEPKILFYEDNPLSGILFNNALSKGFTLADGETSIIALPYFFTPNDPLDKDIRYTWSINNTKIALPPKINELVVKKGASTGTAKITLQIQNNLKLFQDATNTLFVTLGK